MPAAGRARAGMGIDAADWENSGRFGILVGNFSGEGLSLFANDGQAFFTDESHRRGVVEPSLVFLTFGLFFCDFDLDGWQDALAANGYIEPLVDEQGTMVTYRERPLLLRSQGNGQYQEIGERCGPALARPLVGRGAAWADIDNDGDPDFAILSNGEGVSLYRNDGGERQHWVRCRAVGRKSNRDGIGALIRVTGGGVTRSQYVRSGGSYLSESQREPIFGLGRAAAAESVEVRWPSGTVTRAGPLPANRRYLIDEQTGISPAE
jgi:hypothetical protein